VLIDTLQIAVDGAIGIREAIVGDERPRRVDGELYRGAPITG
jgi:hypothetical protein